MDLRLSDEGGEARFASYVEGSSECLGHPDRVTPMRSYRTGPLLPGGRESVEPMAARPRPDRTSAEHQSPLHFVGQSPWDADAPRRWVREAPQPAPDAGLGVARASHDLGGADAIGAEQHDLLAPDMLARTVPVIDQRRKAVAVGRRNRERYSCAHAPDPHAPLEKGAPTRTLLSGGIH